MDIKRNSNVYLIAIPAIILAIALKVVPLINAFRLPFIDFQPAKGMSHSPRVGLENFSKLFSTFHFKNVFLNTIVMNIEFILLSSAIAILLGLSLSAIEKKWLRNIFIVAFIIPFFLPTSVFSYICVSILSIRPFSFLPSIQTLTDPQNFRPIFIAIESLKISGLLSVVVLAFVDNPKQNSKSRLILAFRAAGLFLLIQLSSILSSDFEMLQAFQNPQVYEVADTIDTFVFRSGLLNAQYSQTATIWFIKFIIQFPIVIAVYYIIKSIFGISQSDEKEDFNATDSGNDVSSAAGIIGILISCLYTFLLVVPFIATLTTKSWSSTEQTAQLFQNANIPKNYIIYLILTLVSTLINFFITITLAYPLTQPSSGGRKTYEVFLLILLAAGQGGIHEYLFYRTLGMVNTFYPHILNGFFSIMNVLVLGSIFAKEKKFNNFSEYFRTIQRPAMALAGLQFIMIWNSYYPSQLFYIASHAMFSPAMMFRNIDLGGAGAISIMSNISVLLFAILVSLPSLIVGIAIYFVVDDRIFISQIRRG